MSNREGQKERGIFSPSGLIFKKRSPNMQCQQVAQGVLQWTLWCCCTAQGMCMLQPFSPALGINSYTSCTSKSTTEVSNNPGKNLRHSFLSSLHPSSSAILYGIQPPTNPDSQQVGKPPFPTHSAGIEPSTSQPCSTQVHAISQPGESLAGPRGWALVWPQHRGHRQPGVGTTF